MIWHIGNTTVRTPYRLKSALTVLSGSALNGNLHGKENEKRFAELLSEQEIVTITDSRLEVGNYDDLGRKWRAALSQLGFISPKLSTEENSNLYGDSTYLQPYSTTSNGYRLIESEIITAQQECFLRSLLAYRIPSILEPRYEKYGFSSFSPLKFVTEILFQLQETGLDGFLSFDEFALFVQVSSSDQMKEVIQGIKLYREGRIYNQGKLRQFKKDYYIDIAEKVSSIPSTLKDYADCSLRYLKATGLFKMKGRGIRLSQSRIELITLIRHQPSPALKPADYLLNLCNGAALPTDDAASAIRVIKNLLTQIEARGASVTDIELEDKPDADLAIIRHQLEGQILLMDEADYANQQAESITEIATWLDAFLNKNKATMPSGEILSIPKGEAPAYLEWIVWRTFLAINSLCNKPWEARRFQIDQDFLPVGTAPGNGPDMIFEFDKSIIVVEVTLTTSSRQEAAEGEPVRRHVAKYAEEFRNTNKEVYGLFIAVNIDSNTAHTFRSGDWYLKDDTKINLQIVPMRLKDFRQFFLSGEKNITELPSKLNHLLMRCRAKANEEAPQWKRSITNIIEHL